MTETPTDSPATDLRTREAADLEAVRQAAKAAYLGDLFPPVRLPPSVRKRDEHRAEREREAAKLNYRGLPQRPIMQFSARKPGPALAKPSQDGPPPLGLKFTQTGKYLIAAGSEPQERESFGPVLYISVVGDKGWATHYPVRGSYKSEGEAAAAALHYGIQIITRQVRDVSRPGEP